MSEFLVFDELGSETSSSGESKHDDAHGEFGVTCKAEPTWSCDSEKAVMSVNAVDAIVP
jgi:hypothetical protein